MKDTDKIRFLNDALRRTFSGGKVVMSRAVNCLPAKEQADIMMAVRTFKSFTEDNDPHSEHDFGAFRCAGHQCNWKIDYYDAKMEYGSPDPADPAKTTRVLTIMLADDY